MITKVVSSATEVGANLATVGAVASSMPDNNFIVQTVIALALRVLWHYSGKWFAKKKGEVE